MLFSTVFSPIRESRDAKVSARVYGSVRVCECIVHCRSAACVGFRASMCWSVCLNTRVFAQRASHRSCHSRRQTGSLRSSLDTSACCKTHKHDHNTHTHTHTFTQTHFTGIHHTKYTLRDTPPRVRAN